MFEHRHEPILSRREFAGRMARSLLVTAGIAATSLLIGMSGYCYFGDLNWLDGLLNAAMILTGMGPVDRMNTSGGKLFSSFYALYSGVAFLSMSAVLTAPIFHRIIHRFHLESDDDAKRPHRKRKK